MEPDRPLEQRCAEAQALSDRVAVVHRRIRGKLPGMDPGDLALILEVMLRPFGSGQRFFLREIAPGIHVF